MKVIKSEYVKFLIDLAFYKKYSELKGPFGQLTRKSDFLSKILMVLIVKQMRFNLHLRMACAFKRIPFIGWFLERTLNIINASDISVFAYYGPGLFFPHPFGLVIGGAVKVRGFSIIFNDVSLGKKLPGYEGGMPTIGYKNILLAGCRVLGQIKTESKVVVGANSIVTKNVSRKKTVVGVNRSIDGVYFS